MHEDNLRSGNLLIERIRISKEHDSKSQKMTVLIVDDSPLIIAKIIELLEDVETVATIKTCGSYYAGLDLLNSFKPKVVLLDINLPDKSGIELLDYIKTYLSKTVVIMVTNRNSEYYKKLCRKMGADHFIDKSKDFEKIASILSSLS